MNLQKADVQTDMQTALEGFCREVLEKEDIHPEDDFIRMGGNSIRALKLAEKIYEKYKVEIPYFELIGRPYIRDWAEIILERMV